MTTDVLIVFLTWAVMLFLLALDAFITDLRKSKKKGVRK